MIKDESAISDLERRYAFMQAVAMVSAKTHSRRADDARHETAAQSRRRVQ
jgi:hypothetical protein